MRTGDYLRTMSKLSLPDYLEDVEVTLDTCVEINTVSVEYAKQQRLKPYIKR